MTIFRIHKTDNYTVMSNHHFKERAMSLKAKGLLSLMLSLPDTWNYSISGLVTLSKDGKDSVMSALSELEKFGYLNRTQVTNNKGQFAGVEYNIYEIPQANNPDAVKENADKQNARKSNAENAHLLSNKELNTNDKVLNVSNKKNKNKVLMDGLLQEVGNADLIELYWSYIDIREDMEAPLTPKTLEMLIARCERLSKGNIRIQKLLLENAIINGWKNVFLPAESELSNVSHETANDLRELFGLD